MLRPYALFGGLVLALVEPACGERSEIIAREREDDGDAGASSGGGSAEPPVGEAGASSGGQAGVHRPRFLAPAPVEGVNDPDAKDQDPTITEDELELFFFSDRAGNADIWRATRASLSAPWSAPVSVDELNTDDLEQNPAISRDGLRIWFSSSRDPVGLYFASRTSRDEPFGAPEPIAIDVGESTGFVIAPSVDSAELRLAISIGASDTRDLYEVVRPSLTTAWGDPALVSGVNTDRAESTPFLIDDGRELLFHSGRSGGGDLFWAYRETPGLPAIHVEPLVEVNDPASFDSHPHLTVNRARLYFGSDRSGNTDIYVAEAE